MMQHGMMQQPNNYWCYPNGMMQQVLPKWYDAAAEWEWLRLLYATTGFCLPYGTAAVINLPYATAAGIDLQHAVITGGRKCAAGRFYLLHAAIGKRSPRSGGI